MRSAALLAVVLIACTSSVAPDGDDGGDNVPPGRVRVIGAISGFNTDDPRIHISVSGRDVTVEVTTYGDGCHARADTHVQRSGMVATVTPYDYAAAPGTACTQPLLSSVHETTIHFELAGTAVIRVRGIDARTRSADNPRGAEITVERIVTLQ